MTAAERAVSFPHQSVAKRAAIVAAGPIANFILAIAIFAGFNYFNGRQVLEPRDRGRRRPAAPPRGRASSRRT